VPIGLSGLIGLGSVVWESLRQDCGSSRSGIFPQHVAHWRSLEDRVMRTHEAVRNQIESLTIASGQRLEVEVDRVPYWQGRSVAG